jgi:hypothetical protein
MQPRRVMEPGGRLRCFSWRMGLRPCALACRHHPNRRPRPLDRLPAQKGTAALRVPGCLPAEPSHDCHHSQLGNRRALATSRHRAHRRQSQSLPHCFSLAFPDSVADPLGLSRRSLGRPGQIAPTRCGMALISSHRKSERWIHILTDTTAVERRYSGTSAGTDYAHW